MMLGMRALFYLWVVRNREPLQTASPSLHTQKDTFPMLAMHVPGPKVPIKPLWARFLAFHTDLRIYGFTPLPPPPLGRPVHADPGIKSPPVGHVKV